VYEGSPALVINNIYIDRFVGEQESNAVRMLVGAKLATEAADDAKSRASFVMNMVWPGTLLFGVNARSWEHIDGSKC